VIACFCPYQIERFFTLNVESSVAEFALEGGIDSVPRLSEIGFGADIAVLIMTRSR